MESVDVHWFQVKNLWFLFYLSNLELKITWNCLFSMMWGGVKFYFIFPCGYLIDPTSFIEKTNKINLVLPHCLVMPTYNFVINQVPISSFFLFFIFLVHDSVPLECFLPRGPIPLCLNYYCFIISLDFW